MVHFDQRLTGQVFDLEVDHFVFASKYNDSQARRYYSGCLDRQVNAFFRDSGTV